MERYGKFGLISSNCQLLILIQRTISLYSRPACKFRTFISVLLSTSHAMRHTIYWRAMERTRTIFQTQPLEQIGFISYSFNPPNQTLRLKNQSLFSAGRVLSESVEIWLLIKVTRQTLVKPSWLSHLDNDVSLWSKFINTFSMKNHKFPILLLRRLFYSSSLLGFCSTAMCIVMTSKLCFTLIVFKQHFQVQVRAMEKVILFYVIDSYAGTHSKATSSSWLAFKRYWRTSRVWNLKYDHLFVFLPVAWDVNVVDVSRPLSRPFPCALLPWTLSSSWCK